jgi:hypothetical protein
VSKLRVVREISALLKCDSHRILCIGDKGCWPGNDFELLAMPYALSVDEVSTEISTGWNLAMPGERGTEATVRYLKKLVKSKGGFRLKSLMPESG